MTFLRERVFENTKTKKLRDNPSTNFRDHSMGTADFELCSACLLVVWYIEGQEFMNFSQFIAISNWLNFDHTGLVGTFNF